MTSSRDRLQDFDVDVVIGQIQRGAIRHGIEMRYDLADQVDGFVQGGTKAAVIEETATEVEEAAPASQESGEDNGDNQDDEGTNDADNDEDDEYDEGDEHDEQDAHQECDDDDDDDDEDEDESPRTTNSKSIRHESQAAEFPARSLSPSPSPTSLRSRAFFSPSPLSSGPPASLMRLLPPPPPPSTPWPFGWPRKPARMPETELLTSLLSEHASGDPPTSPVSYRHVTMPEPVLKSRLNEESAKASASAASKPLHVHFLNSSKRTVELMPMVTESGGCVSSPLSNNFVASSDSLV